MNATATDNPVSYEHGGITWEIPADLIDLQRQWDDAHVSVETLVESDNIKALNAARSRRLGLTDRIVHHSWLLEHVNAGRRFQADLALKACARS